MRYFLIGMIIVTVIFYAVSAQWSQGEQAMANNNESSKVCTSKKTISIVMDSSFNSAECRAIAECLKKDAENKTVSVQIVDIQNYNLPFIYTKTPPMLGSASSDPVIKKWAMLINKSDAFIFIAVEHNGSCVGTFKNALDLLYAEWNNKPVGLVIYSQEFSVGSVLMQQMRKVTRALKMTPVPGDVVITPSGENKVSAFFLTDSIKTQLQVMIDQVITAPTVGLVTKIKNGAVRHVQKIGFKIVQAFSGIVHLFYKKPSSCPAASSLSKLHVPHDFNVKIMLGSTRNARVSVVIGNAIKKIMEQLGVHASILDLKEYNLPGVTDIAPVIDSPQNKTKQEWTAAIAYTDALIIVLPEYNAGLPGVLKNALDSLDKQGEGTLVGIVSYSAGRGGKNAVANLETVLAHLKMKTVQPLLYIPNTWQVLDSKGTILQAGFSESLRTLIQNLINQY